ncbi:hypothetical protein Celaphus_00002510, partial [Cervus elaphus hippelaphus]
VLGAPRSPGLSLPGPSKLGRGLALYVYEYLLHVGAQKSAQTFLSEVSGTPPIIQFLDTPSSPSFDGKKTSRWENRLGFCTRGGAYFGTFTVQLLKGETLVNIQVKQKPFMITAEREKLANGTYG